MKRPRTSLVTAAICILAVATPLILWSCLPYPISIYWDAKLQTRYNPTWTVSKADFKAAERLVKKELALFEIIQSVHVESPEKITFMTLKRWSGPLAASGHLFTVERRVKEWVLRPSVGMWIS